MSIMRPAHCSTTQTGSCDSGRSGIPNATDRYELRVAIATAMIRWLLGPSCPVLHFQIKRIGEFRKCRPIAFNDLPSAG